MVLLRSLPTGIAALGLALLALTPACDEPLPSPTHEPKAVEARPMSKPAADPAATISNAPEPHARPSLTEPGPGNATPHVDAPPVAPSHDAHPSRSSSSPSQARSPDASARTEDGSTKTCCRVCRKGKACGDTCVSLDRNCTAGPGCACNG